MPGIVKDITLTLEELAKAFNAAWSLEDRIKLVKNLNLDENTRVIEFDVVGRLLKQLNIDDLSVSQLLILDSVLNETKEKIENKKEEIIRSKK